MGTARDLFYIVGPPGVGKSTLMAALTVRCSRFLATRPFRYDLLVSPEGAESVELGGGRVGGFPGTDALSMSVQPRAIMWMEDSAYDLVLAEGDRLANVKFLRRSAEMGWRLNVVNLVAPEEVLNQRCAGRGSNQSLTWRAGRLTKVANVVKWLAEEHPDVTFTLSAQRTPGEMIMAVRLAFPDVMQRLGWRRS